jgi:hypothetical protein
VRPSAVESAALLDHAREQGWWFRAKEDIVRDFVRPYLQPRAAVLILGSGEGSTVERVRQLAPDCAIAGLDIDPEAIACAGSAIRAGHTGWPTWTRIRSPGPRAPPWCSRSTFSSISLTTTAWWLASPAVCGREASSS